MVGEAHGRGAAWASRAGRQIRGSLVARLRAVRELRLGCRHGPREEEDVGSGGKPKMCKRVERSFRLQASYLHFFALFSSPFHCHPRGVLQGHVIMPACKRVQLWREDDRNLLNQAAAAGSPGDAGGTGGD